MEERGLGGLGGELGEVKGGRVGMEGRGMGQFAPAAYNYHRCAALGGSLATIR